MTTNGQTTTPDLEHALAQWLAAHGNAAGAQWVYDAVAEITALRARLSELEAGETRTAGVPNSDGGVEAAAAAVARALATPTTEETTDA